MLQCAINDVANDTSRANAAKVLQVLKMVTEAALIDRHIEINPGAAVKVKRTGEAKDKWKVIQPDKIGQFFAALETIDTLDEKWRMMLLLEMELGARLAEVRGLTPAVVDFRGCEVTINCSIGEARASLLDQVDEWDRWPDDEYRIGKCFFHKETKSNRVRVIPIDQEIASMLENYVIRNEIGEHDLLFPSPKGGPLGGSFFGRAVWKPFLRDAGLPDMRFHDLRHTVASYALDSGELTWQEVMALMGWSTVAMAQQYTHLLTRPDRKTVSVRNKAYGRPERSLKAV